MILVVKKQMKSKLIIFVHGFNKHGDDMQFLAQRLEDEDTDCYIANLPTTFSSLDVIVKKLTSQLAILDLSKYKSIDFVAHSMGGIIACEYISKNFHANIKNLICIGTPFKGSRLSDIAKYLPFYTMLYKPIKSLMTNRDILILESKNIKVHLIAATKTKGLLGKLLSKRNDGLVDLDSAYAYPEAFSRNELHYDHWEVHKTQDCVELITKLIL